MHNATCGRSIEIVIGLSLSLSLPMYSLELLFRALRALSLALLSGHELDDDDKKLRVSLLVLERVPERVRSG